MREDKLLVELILNNNALLVSTENSSEAIIRSKGVGFRYKKGDCVDNSEIEKIYYLQSEAEKSDYQSLIKKLPSEYFDLSEKLFSYATKRLKIEFPLSAVIGLTDHISFAVERMKKGLVIQNMMSMLVEQLHPIEYGIGKYAVHLVNIDLGIVLPEEEIGNIALHLLNYSSTTDNVSEVLRNTKAIKDIVNIVRFSFTEPIDTDSLNYSRFLTHLQFFIQRISTGTYFADESNEIYRQIQRKYKLSFDCAQRIKEYIFKIFSVEIGQEEVVYLTVHINRLISRSI